MLESDQCIVVYCAGDSRVNGCFIESLSVSENCPMYRKIDSNIGIVKFQGKWYISDCGDEFAPSGESHLDFYSADATSGTLPIDCLWSKEEDGIEPSPRSKLCDPRGLVTLFSALRVAGSRYMSVGDYQSARIHLESVLAIGSGEMKDFVKLAELHVEANNFKDAWDLLLCLSTKEDILSDCNYAPKYTLEDRMEISTLCIGAFEGMYSHSYSIDDLTKSLTMNPSILRFTEFTDYICLKIKSLVVNEETERAFQLAGGLELAISLRGVYRQIDLYTFGSRDAATTRMKIFSLTDSFRQFTSDCRPDAKGRDPTFKTFWEAGMTKGEDRKDGYDPREMEARSKDNDPAKEVKCTVIKSINDAGETDTTKFEMIRKRLIDSKVSDTVYSVSDLHAHDCNNSVLKLISIHGIVFDVTENLEKYAPDGEYYFFAGHDITYPLAVSALSGDHVDKLYKMTSEEHLKRIYGWMEYFEKKYKVMGWLGEWDNENTMEDPPAGDEEPEMQCRIM